MNYLDQTLTSTFNGFRVELRTRAGFYDLIDLYIEDEWISDVEGCWKDSYFKHPVELSMDNDVKSLLGNDYNKLITFIEDKFKDIRVIRENNCVELIEELERIGLSNEEIKYVIHNFKYDYEAYDYRAAIVGNKQQEYEFKEKKKELVKNSSYEGMFDMVIDLDFKKSVIVGYNYYWMD
jgi:uncharacterized protein YeeX (DUF496 family)